MWTLQTGAMDLATLGGAVEVLVSPLEWDSPGAWLAECLRRVRGACDAPAGDLPADPATELEALLHLPDDEPGWLHAALASPGAETLPARLPAEAGGSEALLRVVSLRCALAAGVAALHRSTPALPTTQELRVHFGLRGREPQVALLAAEGLSNRAIADRLRLSAHTVRHYLERVLDRLGIHTRKGLALHLMAGGAERPRPRRPPG
jgi:DNA-binding CsgD family transcriptional regulator